MFHVYHKVKGDRAGPADYRLLASHPTREQAKAEAEKYNNEHGYKASGFHRAVVRTRMVQ